MNTQTNEIENYSSYLQKVLHREFNKRKEEDDSYSIRSFSKHLDMYSGSVSAMMKNKRSWPIKKLNSLAEKLELTQDELDKIRKEIKAKKEKKNEKAEEPKSIQLETLVSKELEKDIVTNWETYAILNLIRVKGFQSNFSWIGKRLNLTEREVQFHITNLLNAGMIFETENGDYVRTSSVFGTRSGIPSEAIKDSHKDSARLALKKLDEVKLENRYYGHQTFAVSKENIQEAKKLLHEFKLKFSNIINSEEKSDVYRLNLQFFPLTIERKE